MTDLISMQRTEVLPGAACLTRNMATVPMVARWIRGEDGEPMAAAEFSPADPSHLVVHEVSRARTFSEEARLDALIERMTRVATDLIERAA